MSKRIVKTLSGQPVAPNDARRAPTAGGLPDTPGLYVWWVKPGSLPGVPHRPHPDPDVKLDLLYVGIAPNSPSSGQTIRSRVMTFHLGGNTGSSTFRLSLASLLMDQEGYEPTTTTTKCVLTREDNARLSAWQRANLAITWCEAPEPWSIEGDVIEAMEPPLNLAENSAHPFYATMRTARRHFRNAARGR